MQFNAAQREIILKAVYYGPPLSGKTTNLQAVHRLLNPAHCGRMTILNTSNDRTLFFDLLPVFMKIGSGFRIKLKLFTVPGQVIHAATRRLVLAGADGVIFVADSQLSEAALNNEYWHGMRRYMVETGLDPETIPTVIQFNKRDLDDIRSDEELDKLREMSSEPLLTASAINGTGVLETLKELLRLVFVNLNEHHDFENKFNVSSDEFINAMFKDAAPPGTPIEVES